MQRCPRLVAIVLALLTSQAGAQTPPVSLGEPIPVERPFASRETKEGTPRGISGFACLPPDQGRRACLAINDEERFAEWAWFDGQAITPTGKLVELLSGGKQPGDTILGARPQGICAKEQGFGEFDGEAIAIARDQVYLTGSHACSRAKGHFRPSSFILARALALPKGRQVEEVERTWRLAEVFRQSPLADAFGQPGPLGSGIEGMAVVGERLFLGLRTPAPDKASLLSVEVAPLFAPEEPSSSRVQPRLLPLALGTDTGIRDLAALAHGRLLVLAGPADNGSAPFVLHLLNPDTGQSRPLVELRTDAQGRKKGGGTETPKAEALAVLEETSDRVSVLVLYDNIDEGGPRLHQVKLPTD